MQKEELETINKKLFFFSLYANTGNNNEIIKQIESIIGIESFFFDDLQLENK